MSMWRLECLHKKSMQNGVGLFLRPLYKQQARCARSNTGPGGHRELHGGPRGRPELPHERRERRHGLRAVRARFWALLWGVFAWFWVLSCVFMRCTMI